MENLLWRVENLEFSPAIRQIVILSGNNIDANTPNDIANGLLCSLQTYISYYEAASWSKIFYWKLFACG